MILHLQVIGLGERPEGLHDKVFVVEKLSLDTFSMSGAEDNPSRDNE